MPTKGRVRKAALADRAQIEVLLDGFQLRSATTCTWGPQWWEWLCERNPALGPDRADFPWGWVLEANGEIVGFFGNIPMLYRFGQQTLLASIASHWAVIRPFRAQTDELATAYFGQPVVDLLMVTSGIQATGRIFERHGALPMPLSDYQRVLYWVIDPEGFVAAALLKKNIQPALSRFCGLALAPLLKNAARLTAHRPGPVPSGVHLETTGPNAVTEEFDELWERKSAERPRLYAYRRTKDLRWHFECASRQNDVKVICCRRAGRLEGFAVLSCEETVKIGLVRAKLVDLFVASDSLDLVSALLSGAYEQAKARGCHLLELVGFPAEFRALAQRFRPLSRLYPSFPFYYKTTSTELHVALGVQEAWHPTLYDGDSSLF